VLTATVRLLRTASIVICLIVLASFLVFALDQTKSASAAQQEALGPNPTKTTAAATATPAHAQPKHENSVHETLDEASNSLTSPFSGVVSGSAGEWATRSVRALLALLVYGFGLGYLARALRVRT
jgi:hypothetical protein